MDNKRLKEIENDYLAYVGDPKLYDFMGATQFRLLCSLGLRAHHTLLDIGCGSLRAGRFFINYLDSSNYHGIEPNKWLIEEGITNQIGQDLIRIKNPHFDYNSNFETNVFLNEFDFILAQGIFTHAGIELVRLALKNTRESLKSNGFLVANFCLGLKGFQETGWVYPEMVKYRQKHIKYLAKDAGLSFVKIPWYNPRLTWYVFAKERNRLPNRAMLRYLKGSVLFEKEFLDSWSYKHKLIRSTRIYLGQILPEPIKSRLKKLMDLQEAV